MNESRYTEKDLKLLDILSSFTSATIYEALGQTGAFSSVIKPIDPSSKACGFAYTVQGKPADNLALHHAIYRAQSCEVIVASVRGYTESGYWGEVMTCAARCRGLRGLIFDGAVRDTAEIISSGFPVFCQGTCIKCTEKSYPGAYGVPIVVGGVRVEPGDLIFGDRDGVVVVPRARLEEIVPPVTARIEKEAVIEERLKKGESTIDIYHLMKTDS